MPGARPVTSIKDSLSREVTIEYGFNDIAPYGLCDRIKFKGSGGVERIIRISYSSLSSVFATGYSPQSKNQMFRGQGGEFHCEAGLVNTKLAGKVARE